MKTFHKLFFLLFGMLTMVLNLPDTLSQKVFTLQAVRPANAPPLLLNVDAIELGGIHTCALTMDGGVKCWGKDGQVGDGITISYLTPSDVFGLTSGVSSIASGDSHNCALTSEGVVKCWGVNWFGQLGDNTTIDKLTPVEVSGLVNDIMAISAGGNHTCALTSSGGVKCWGLNHHGQLGDGTTTKSLTPIDVFGLTNGVIAISAGGNHTCALTSSGGVKCWGLNRQGQLGDGTTTDQLTPIDVFGLTSGVISISAGGNHTCALTSSGRGKCWGGNQQGQLGDGTTVKRLTPVNVIGLAHEVTVISSGDNHTCALTTNSGVKCWGSNRYGQLGDGTRTSRTIPVNVSGLSGGANAIFGGDWHTCVLTLSGKVKCWGGNEQGQLGDGTNTKRLTPVNVILLDMFLFQSIGSHDGFIRESTETSNAGSKVFVTDATLFIGDDNLDRQYRAILSFNTSALPDNAAIFSAKITLHWAGLRGDDPYWTSMTIDVASPFFGKSVQLSPEDFQAIPSQASIGTFPLSGNTDVANLKSTTFPYINLTGKTQFRIRYDEDDNNDMDADCRIFESGDSVYAGYHPLLIVQYYVP